MITNLIKLRVCKSMRMIEIYQSKRLHPLSILSLMSVGLIIDIFYVRRSLIRIVIHTPLPVDSVAQLVERRSSNPKLWVQILPESVIFSLTQKQALG